MTGSGHGTGSKIRFQAVSASEIAPGTARPMLTDYEPARLSISAVRSRTRLPASKVRVFIDFWAEIVARYPSLALKQGLRFSIPAVQFLAPEFPGAATRRGATGAAGIELKSTGGIASLISFSTALASSL
jgi:hypothetical protein